MKDGKKIQINTLLQRMDDSTVEELYGCLQDLISFKVVKLEAAMIMVSTKDVYGTDFYMGEVLVTVCELECSKVVGWGCVHGENAKKAFISAAIDFFQNCGDEYKSDKEKFSTLLASRQKQAIETIELEMKMVASTKVNFGTMVEG